MNLLEIKLNWYRDSKGYRLVDRGKHGLRIVGRGGKLDPTHPIAENDKVYFAFSKLKSPSQILDFVGKYGLLVEPAYDVEIPLPMGSCTSYAGQLFRQAPNGD